MSNLIGGFIANKRKREAEEAYNDAIDAQIADLDREANANYLDRADSRDALRKVTDANTETLRQLNTEAIRGGATDEAKVAMASKLNKTTADVVGNLAAMGEKHKDALNTQKRSLQLGAAQHKYTTRSDVSGMENVLQSIGTAAQNLGTAWVKDTPANGVVANNGVGTRTVSDMEPELIDKLKQVHFGQSK